MSKQEIFNFVQIQYFSDSLSLYLQDFICQMGEIGNFWVLDWLPYYKPIIRFFGLNLMNLYLIDQGGIQIRLENRISTV